MARIPRIMITGAPTVYHVISRTALEGFPLADIEKDFLVELIYKASQLWFMEIYGFCCMGNHFRLLVRMLPDTDFSDADILKRLLAWYGDDRVIGADQLPAAARNSPACLSLWGRSRFALPGFTTNGTAAGAISGGIVSKAWWWKTEKPWSTAWPILI